MGHEVSDNTRLRLEELTETYRDAKEAFEARRDKWQAAITRAVDDGMRPADVGRIVGVTQQRILTIVARIYSKDDQQ
jgi:predicted transcriptional regulator